MLALPLVLALAIAFLAFSLLTISASFALAVRPLASLDVQVRFELFMPGRSS